MTGEAMKENVVINDLKDPILITAFSSPQKGGATATSALDYAIERWEAEPVTTFDTGGFYNYARVRPYVRRDGDETVIDWPENTVYRVDGPEHSFLLLTGVEPNMNWQQFVTGIAGFASRHGVETAVNLKAVPAMVLHTAEVPVRAIYSSPELEAEYQFPVLEEQDGPADIGRILNLHMASEGCRTIDLYAMEPFYGAAFPDAGASLSLLQALRSGFDLAVDVEPMVESASVQRQALDAVVASSEQLQQTLSALEQRAGANRLLGEGSHGLVGPAAELDASSVLDEVEDIFRGFGEDNEDAPDD